MKSLKQILTEKIKKYLDEVSLACNSIDSRKIAEICINSRKEWLQQKRNKSTTEGLTGLVYSTKNRLLNELLDELEET